MSLVSSAPVLVLFNSVLTLLCCIIGSGQRSSSPFTEPALKPGGIKVAIQEAAVTPLLPVLAYEFERFMENITIPEQKVNRVSVEETYFRNVTVGSATVKFEEPNKIILKFWNVSATVPFTRFVYHSFWCYLYPCSGSAQAEIRNGSVALWLDVSAGRGGLLDIHVGSSEIGMRDPLITLIGEGKSKMPKWLGGRVKDMYDKDVLPKLGHHIITAANQILANKTKEIFHMFPIVFVNSSKIEYGQMRLELVVLPDAADKLMLTEKVFSPRQPFPNFPVAVVSSFTALNNMLRLMIKSGHLVVRVPFPLRYVISSNAAQRQLDRLCSGCASEATFELKTAPWLKSLNKKLFTFNYRDVEVAVDLLPRGGAPISLFSMLMNVSAQAAHIALVDGATHANLDSVDTNVSVTSSRIDGLDSSTMNTKIRDLINLSWINLNVTYTFPAPFDLCTKHVNITSECYVAGFNLVRALGSLSILPHLR
uniref:Expression site-associated gene 5 (ESAG5) protein n=1 Tax=Trypanosoma brucei brucei TaxID=5702 RepID=B3GVJ4_TRYBB|nr:expression site-associated gene 5 (ESAG5) protein [Trypanosoma brucei brucei]